MASRAERPRKLTFVWFRYHIAWLVRFIVARRREIWLVTLEQLLEAMGVDRVVCVDLHCGAIQGFFPPAVPVDNLSAMTIGQDYFMRLDAEDFAPLDNIVVVSPDAGGVYYCGACFASPISSCGLWAKSLGVRFQAFCAGFRSGARNRWQEKSTLTDTVRSSFKRE